MPSEREEMQMLPLNPSHVCDFLKRLTGTGTQSAREILDGLLQAAMQLPSVDSANLLFNDTKHGTVRFAWLGLDGEFAEGDHLRLEELPWRSAIEHGQIWMAVAEKMIGRMGSRMSSKESCSLMEEVE
jgi:hypothetical protein